MKQLQKNILVSRLPQFIKLLLTTAVEKTPTLSSGEPRDPAGFLRCNTHIWTSIRTIKQIELNPHYILKSCPCLVQHRGHWPRWCTRQGRTRAKYSSMMGGWRPPTMEELRSLKKKWVCRKGKQTNNYLSNCWEFDVILCFTGTYSLLIQMTSYLLSFIWLTSHIHYLRPRPPIPSISIFLRLPHSLLFHSLITIAYTACKRTYEHRKTCQYEYWTGRVSVPGEISLTL